MKKTDIKDNVDDMVLQICKYIKASDLSNKEDSKIKLECAMTFLFASIDFTDNPTQNINYILEQYADAIVAILDKTSDALVEYILGILPGEKLL